VQGVTLTVKSPAGRVVASDRLPVRPDREVALTFSEILYKESKKTPVTDSYAIGRGGV
jgi:hypothetical protein